MERFSYAALYHSGTRGMHWGQRNYQNEDGTWTELGKARRRKGGRWTGAGAGYAAYTTGKRMFYEESNNDVTRNWYTDPTSLSVHSAFANELAQHSKIPVKTGQSTIEEDIEKANPNRGYGNYTDNNCVGAALAYCLRRYGLDAQASAIPHGTTGDACAEWLKWNPGNYGINSVRDNFGTNDACFAIRKEITQMTTGKCGLLRVGYSPDGSAGHMMAWERLSNGNVIIVNPQDKTMNPHDWIFNLTNNGRIVTYDWTDGITVDWNALEGGPSSEYGYCVERYRGA